MFITVAFDVLILAYILSRQVRVRIVPRDPRLHLPAILALIGLLELIGYTSDHHHHVTSADYAWLLGTLMVGAAGLGALRALTVRIWVYNNWVVRQGTWVTLTLWVVSLSLHYLSEIGAGHTGGSDLVNSSLLLYIGVTFAVQNLVVHQRALPLWQKLGPDAGQRMQVNFGQGPGGGATFFTTFRNFGGDAPPPQTYDPNIIDAEVVEDDEDPPQLR